VAPLDAGVLVEMVDVASNSHFEKLSELPLKANTFI
jgi:hypothetical protein